MVGLGRWSAADVAAGLGSAKEEEMREGVAEVVLGVAAVLIGKGDYEGVLGYDLIH